MPKTKIKKITTPKAIMTWTHDMDIDVLRAIQDIGYVIVRMPVLDPDRLERKRQQQTGWNPILPTHKFHDKFQRNHNDNGKRLQKKTKLNRADTSVLCQWLKKNNLHQHYLTNIALLRSMRGCKRQAFHTDTAEANAYHGRKATKCSLGVVCCPFDKAKLYIK